MSTLPEAVVLGSNERARLIANFLCKSGYYVRFLCVSSDSRIVSALKRDSYNIYTTSAGGAVVEEDVQMFGVQALQKDEDDKNYDEAGFRKRLADAAILVNAEYPMNAFTHYEPSPFIQAIGRGILARESSTGTLPVLNCTSDRAENDLLVLFAYSFGEDPAGARDGSDLTAIQNKTTFIPSLFTYLPRHEGEIKCEGATKKLNLLDVVVAEDAFSTWYAQKLSSDNPEIKRITYVENVAERVEQRVLTLTVAFVAVVVTGRTDNTNGVLAEVSAFICGQDKSTITTDEQKALVHDFRRHLPRVDREVEWDHVASCLLYPASVLNKIKKPTDQIKAVAERVISRWSRDRLPKTTEQQFNHYKGLAKDEDEFWSAMLHPIEKETDTYKWAKEALKKAGIYGKLR